MAWWDKRYNALTGNQNANDSGGISVPSTQTPNDTQVQNSWWGNRYQQVQQLEQQRQIQLQQQSNIQQEVTTPAPTFFQRAKTAVSKLFGKEESSEPTPVGEVGANPSTLKWLGEKFKIGSIGLLGVIQSGTGVALGNVSNELSQDKIIASQQNVVNELEKKVASGDTKEYKIPVRFNKDTRKHEYEYKTAQQQLEEERKKLDEMLKKDASETTLEEKLKESGQKTREKQAEKQMDVLKEYGAPKKWSAKWLLGEVVEATPQFLGSFGAGVVTALVTKNPAVALSVGFGTSFVQESGSGYQSAKEAGLSDSRAQDVAVAQGTANAIIEQIPLGEWLSKTPGGDEVKKSILKKVQQGIIDRAKGGFYEGVTETMQEIVGNAIQATYEENPNFFEGAIEAGVISFPLGFIGSGGSSSNEIIDTKAIDRANELVSEAINTPVEQRTEQQNEVLNSLNTTEVTVDEAKNLLSEYDADTFFNQQLSNVIKIAEQENKNINITLNENTGNVEFKLTDKPITSTDYRPAETITRDNAGKFVKESEIPTITIYRGSEGNLGAEGNYYTTSKEFANEFTGGMEENMIQKEVNIDKIYRPDPLPEATNATQLDQAIAEAKDKGYDAVFVDEGTPFGEPVESVFVINQDKLFSQEELSPSEALKKLKEPIEGTPDIEAKIRKYQQENKAMVDEAMLNLLDKSNSTPVASGKKRFYQLTGDTETPWLWDNTKDMRDWAEKSMNRGEKLRFVDLNPSDVEKQTNGAFIAREGVIKKVDDIKNENVKNIIRGTEMDASSSTKPDYKYTYNLNNPDDAEYVARVFSENQVEEFKNGDYGRYKTKDRVEELLRARLVTEDFVDNAPQLAESLIENNDTTVLDKPLTVYHGGSNDFINQLESGKGFVANAERDAGTGGNRFGLSTSTNSSMARNFSTSTGKGSVAEIVISKGARVLEIKNEPEFLDDYSEKVTEIIADSFDVITDKNNTMGENEVRILNPAVIESVNGKDIVSTNENIESVIRGTKSFEGHINEIKRVLNNLSEADSRPREGVDKDTVAKSPTELKNVIDSLNKFGQAYAILRKTGGISNPKAVGQFVSAYGKLGATVAPEGEVRFRGKYIANDKDYMSVQAHELGHAIEYHITGQINKNTLDIFGDNLTKEQRSIILSELKEVTLTLEGQNAIDQSPRYYNMPTELLARFFELYIVNNELLKDIAPEAYSALEIQSVRHPMIREFMEIIDDNMRAIDTPGKMFLPDLRQTYQKALGSKKVGNIAYHAEVVHRALVERAKLVLPKFIESKFKDVKDSPETLFRSAESILVTKEGVPQFGTRDFIFSNNAKEIQKAKDMGYVEVAEVYRDGEKVKQLAKQRYTAEEGKALFESLSPEGQQLIKDFTAQREEAKDYFNREIIKDVNKINSDIEGWVHHYFDEGKSNVVGKKLRFRNKKAGARKFRSGTEGYVEDFKKAMTKALVDLETEKVYNDFIQKQFSTVSKPIPEGKNADDGWVEVVGTLKKGIGTKGEKRSVIIKDGKSFVPKQTRYQVPKAIYQRYQMHRGLIEEAGKASKIIQRINSYWAINVLSSAGTAGTNFIGGGIQFSTKVLSDFYLETLTGNVDYKQTKRNLSAMLKVLSPKGWNNAPDWVYGGDMSNYYGQFSPKQVAKVDKAIDKFADTNLKLFGAYERYWKKVISLAENVQDLESLQKVDKEGLKLPTDLERKALAQINKEIDLYAYDYDNIPMWLSNMKKNPVATGIKPFATYPYKYAKQITEMAGSVFDRSLSWQERTAKLLSLSTVMGLYAMYSLRRKEEQETPLADSPETEIRARSAGNVFTGITDSEGNELFVRVSKYPFIGLTEAALQTMKGNSQASSNILKEMLGSVGFIGTTALHLAGYRDEYEKYDSPEVIYGNDISSLVPYMRLLSEMTNATDPFKRKQSTFLQASVGKLIPVTNENLQEKLHGEKRTITVPIEGEVKRTPGTKYTRTTIDKTLKNYWQDIVLGSLTGIYIKRVNPKDVEAQIIRDEKNRNK